MVHLLVRVLMVVVMMSMSASLASSTIHTRCCSTITTFAIDPALFLFHSLSSSPASRTSPSDFQVSTVNRTTRRGHVKWIIL